MNINIITAPDLLFNQTQSICLIEPTVEIKKQLENQLVNVDYPINIYLYEKNTNDLKWLLSVVNMVDMTILDTESLGPNVYPYISYILSLPNVWYKSNTDWGLINKNRFYDFPPLN